MATFALTNAYLYCGGHDFTGDANTVSLKASGEQRDKTNMRSGGWRESLIGLKTVEMACRGWWQSDTADAVDVEVFPNLGVGGEPTTISAQETEAQATYMLKALKSRYQLLGQIGDTAPFDLTGVSSDGVGAVQGQLLAKMAAVSATGATGTATQLGAVSATQSLYGTFHVFGTPGTTITAVIESSVDNTFAAPTTRATFGPLTTAGGTWLTPVAGAITDTWWRLNVTAITGTFTVACAAGIR